MLAPREITNKKFEKGAFGYKADEVDTYLSMVADEYAKVLSERNELDKKLTALADKLEQYRQEEGSLSAVLIGAQRLGDSIVKEAKNKAELMLRDAGIKSDKMLEGAHMQLEREKSEFNRLQKEVSTFKANVLAMYKTHLELVSALPGAEESKYVESREEKAYLEKMAEEEAAGQYPEGPEMPAFEEPENMNDIADQISLDMDLDESNEAPPMPDDGLTFSTGNGDDEAYYDSEAEEYSNIKPIKRKVGFLPDLEEKPEEKQTFTFDENYTEYEVPYGATEVMENEPEPVEEDGPPRSSKFGELRFGHGYDLTHEDEQGGRRRKKRR